jgi:hypothetical protein
VVPEYILTNGNVSVTMSSDTVTSRGSGRDLQMPTPKKAAFLAAYAVTCSITAAAKGARINRGTHYDWLQADPEYKANRPRSGAAVPR